MKRIACILGLIVGLLGLGADAASAQNSSQTSRSYVQAPQVIGMGDAGVAVPSTETGFFYNPAHIGRVAQSTPRINLAGVTGSASTSVFDQIDFFENRLQPAFDRGIDSMPEDSLRSLYQDTFDQGRQRAGLDGQLLMPSVIVGGDRWGIGAGFFAGGDVSYQIRDAGLGVPLLDIVGHTDLMAVGTGAMSVQGVTLGVAGKYTQRYLSFKNKPADAFQSDEEVFLLSGTSFGVDVGFLYDIDVVSIPGTIRVGGAVHDLVATDFDYQHVENPSDAFLVGSLVEAAGTTENADRETIAERENVAAEQHEVAPSYRAGVAYQSQSFGVINAIDVAIDYVGYTDPPVDQTTWAHVHAGLQVELLNRVQVRTGLTQGYPAVGAGVRLGVVHLDYAYHSVEDGRTPGQLRHARHTAQLTFSI